jgi:hypothetical protein
LPGGSRGLGDVYKRQLPPRVGVVKPFYLISPTGGVGVWCHLSSIFLYIYLFMCLTLLAACYTSLKKVHSLFYRNVKTFFKNRAKIKPYLFIGRA